MRESVKCLIIGSGPAGYTAAIYASRASLNPVLYEGLQPGGQLTTTTIVENYPGFAEGVDANDLMMQMRTQAERLGTQIRRGTISKVDFSCRPYLLTTDEGCELEAESVIIATGASAKYLGLESERRFRGMGVSACATCDGFFYRGRIVAVVGGGDTACEEASYLANLCKKVYLIVRRDELRASKAMQERVLTNEKIEILWKCQTREILGDMTGVKGVQLINSEGEMFEKQIDGFFLAIGHHPNSDIFRDWIDCDENGYIKTNGEDTGTNVPGVFAAGDVQDPRYRQAINAAASGCRAALDAERYLLSNN